MDNAEFDTALVTSAFALAAERGWSGVSVAQAAAMSRFNIRISFDGRSVEPAPGYGSLLSGLVSLVTVGGSICGSFQDRNSQGPLIRVSLLCRRTIVRSVDRAARPKPGLPLRRRGGAPGPRNRLSAAAFPR